MFENCLTGFFPQSEWTAGDDVGFVVGVEADASADFDDA
jgi:hypothetical protein